MRWIAVILVALVIAPGADTLRVEKPDRVGRRIENEYFIADLSHRVIQDKEEDSGTLRALTYKPFGVTLLRTRNRMHWAPNLQRAGAPGYKGIGTWHPVQEFQEELRGDTYIHRRAGYLADYPEVKIEAEYRFFAGVPYFLFWSRLTVEKPLVVTLLRNNEMTMDQFFTHLAWPDRDGRQQVTTFDERKPLLEKEPIAADAPWLAFLNLDKGYGYGFVKLDYQATRSLHPDIGISDGAENGKYWSRHIIIREPTRIEPGDRFEERTAYVLFRCMKGEPLREFFEWERKIRSKFSAAGQQQNGPRMTRIGRIAADQTPAVTIECVAGCGPGPLGGPAKGARLIEPFGVAFDQQGNWYICEYKGQRVTKVDARGIITLFAGGEDQASGRLGFHDPHGLVISRDQQMYVADTMGHRALKFDLKTGRANVVAGTGQPGYAGDGGQALAATFNQLYAVDLNPAGDKLYLTDLRNRRVRLLDLKSGIVTTVAGNGEEGVPVDGAVATDSPLVDPRATAVDSKGNVYILERRGNALRVLDRQGKLRTLISPSNPPRPGVDLNGPKHLCVDRQDNVIIADSENHLIRKYHPKDGTTVVIAGTGEKGDRLVSDDPLKTQLNRPHGVFVHPSGALYISDSDNHRVLKLSNW